MAVPSLPPHEKRELRAALRQRRKAFVSGLSAADKAAASERLAEMLSPLLDAARIVAGYHAIGSEIDPDAALEAATSAGKIIALPSFGAADEVMSFRAAPVSQPGPHGIPQPGPAAPAVTPDLVLVPLLGIDGFGHRIGQGGGHYDRALPALREAGAVLVGVGWPCQRIEPAIEAEAWDVPLDGFGSSERLEMFR